MKCDHSLLQITFTIHGFLLILPAELVVFLATHSSCLPSIWLAVKQKKHSHFSEHRTFSACLVAYQRLCLLLG